MAAPQWTDGELVRRCLADEAAAWRELIRRYTPLTYRVASRMLGAGPEAEDASQEVFVSIHRSLRTFDPARSLPTWIASIAYHACLRRLGKRTRAGVLGAELDEAETAADEFDPGPESRLAGAEEGGWLDHALARLPAQDRALIALRYREGLSDSEVAAAVGIPIGTVKTRLFRARAQLRGWLAPLLRNE